VSTGVVLEDVVLGAADMTVNKPDATSKYPVQISGSGGRILSEVGDAPVTYASKGDEGYVRAKVASAFRRKFSHS
jgi:hypothetical protein